MAKLTPKSAADGLLPLTVGDVSLTEASTRQIWSIQPYPGSEAALHGALPNGFPAPNRTSGKEGARLLWSGRAQAFWIADSAPDAALAAHGALTDQTDAWCVLRLEGVGSADALARLTPLDLRPSQFKRGHTARSLVGHMAAQITKLPKGFEVMVFRSMAGTAVHELQVAMQSVAARRALSN